MCTKVGIPTLVNPFPTLITCHVIRKFATSLTPGSSPSDRYQTTLDRVWTGTMDTGPKSVTPTHMVGSSLTGFSSATGWHSLPRNIHAPVHTPTVRDVALETSLWKIRAGFGPSFQRDIGNWLAGWLPVRNWLHAAGERKFS